MIVIDKIEIYIFLLIDYIESSNMSSISEEKQKVIDGLMNYSLRPYAEANGISLNDLILQLYEYHNNVLVDQYKTIQMEDSSDDEEAQQAEPVKRGRGRPPGKKNIPKNNIQETVTVTIKRGRGRPKKESMA